MDRQQIIEYAKQSFDFSDEQIANLTPTQWRHLEATPRRKQYKIVAEVVKGGNCIHKAKVGDKIVLTAGGNVILEETTFPAICVWALAPMLPLINVVYDRITDRTDDPSPKGWDHFHCADTGVEDGGIGRLLFRVYCEKVR